MQKWFNLLINQISADIYMRKAQQVWQSGGHIKSHNGIIVQEIENFPVQQPNFIHNQKEMCEARSETERPSKTISALKDSKHYEPKLKATPPLVWWINDLYTLFQGFNGPLIPGCVLSIPEKLLSATFPDLTKLL